MIIKHNTGPPPCENNIAAYTASSLKQMAIYTYDL